MRHAPAIGSPKSVQSPIFLFGVEEPRRAHRAGAAEFLVPTLISLCHSDPGGRVPNFWTKAASAASKLMRVTRLGCTPVLINGVRALCIGLKIWNQARSMAM